jgi:hypothetical protein
VDAVAHTESASIGAGQEDGRGADVARPDFRFGSEASQADGNRSRAGADVGDTRCPAANAFCRGSDEPLGCTPRRHHPTWRCQQRQFAEDRFGHTPLCVAGAALLTC